MSRGPSLQVWVVKSVAVIGASPGEFGIIMPQDQWLPVLRTLRADLWAEGRLMVSRAGDLFAAEDNLTDKTSRDRLAAFMGGFLSQGIASARQPG